MTTLTSILRHPRTIRAVLGTSLAVALSSAGGVALATPASLIQQEGDAADAAAPPVGPGDRGELAAWWQDRLNGWLQLSGSETYPIVVDGWYGPRTEAATVEFQEAVQGSELAVPVDGVVDPEDRVALRDAIEALEADPGAPPVGPGDRGELAAWWQDRLNGWLQLSGSETYPIVVDGWYGPRTEAATVEFQEAVQGSELAVPVDGVVDPEDRVALREAIEALVGGTNGGDVDAFGTDTVTSDDFPASGDPSQLQDVRVEEAPGDATIDRLVFEFGADGGDLSYQVAYTETLVDAAGTAVDVEGEATLGITITPASGVDLSGASATPTYTGPARFTPDGSAYVAELAVVEDFEGTMTWAAGLDAERPFRVQVMESPLRLVVDVRSG